jgi:phosphatidylinositol-3-phosphatase
MKIVHRAVIAGLAATAMTGSALAAGNNSAGPEGTRPVQGIEHLDHVFLVMMENHAYGQVIGNPNMPFFNQLARSANLATNYFAVGHPSLTNYLEIVGGSNFGVRNDNSPKWHGTPCAPGHIYLETDSASICPLASIGTDAETPPIDTTNETPGSPTIDVDGKLGFAAAPVVAKTIADQLVARGMSWRAYEESLPPTGADGVNSADGLFSNLNLKSNSTTPATSTYNGGLVFNGTLQSLYAVKHNPFAYFANVQSGADPRNSLKNVVGFDGATGLFADLASGRLPNLVYIVPNQCNDQHGRNGASAGPGCDFDNTDNGTLTGLNPALMYQGDVALERIVGAIKSSPAWNRGTNAIVIVWDENDYSIAPTTNQVALVVDTNEDSYVGRSSHQSNQFYTAFSLLKSMEAGFGLPCLNHACDDNVLVMNDLFPSR